ncbi:hypothetical protein C9374_013877 [Naegleria lovaniensis]|uniref:fumarate reductase (NADH) n=1 Tax=Naegleria lovaniensis TaxID=51637 RepID=A0AA88GUW6_NAELO|nr:uncharacterized protein C9374_013877 [Naegleria lovaniensis]KAG2389317.1 hypothetical protein C9374_013877 [Naegleria lovaniensis]
MGFLQSLLTLAKLGIVSAFVSCFVIVHIYFFLERSPPANTKHLDEMSLNPDEDLRLFSILDESTIPKTIVISGKGSKKSVQPRVLRTIAVDEIGTINSTTRVSDDDKNIYTIFQIHGVPGSRRWRHPIDHHMIRSFGGDKKLRVLSIDRPGVGQTSPVISSIYSDGTPVYNLEPLAVNYYEASALDLLYVVRKLRLKSFSVIAFSQGTPHTYMLAFYLDQLKRQERGEKIFRATPHQKFTETFNNDLLMNILLSKDSDKYWQYDNSVSNTTVNKEWTWQDVAIDNVAFLAPQGYYSESVKEELLKEQNSSEPIEKRWASSLHFFFSMHNYKPPLGTNILYSIYKILSQIGMVTNINYWESNMQPLLDPLGRDAFLFDDEANGWKKVFNNSLIDSYRFTTLTTMVEIINSYYFTENFPSANVDLRTPLKNTKIFIATASDDVVVPIQASNAFIEQFCRNELNSQCTVNAVQNTTHFQLFKTQYKTAIEFISKDVLTVDNSTTLRKPRKTIVVIGGGLAGLAATIEAAATYDQNVILIEKELRLGGNSAKATSGMNALGTKAQKQAMVFDTYTHFWNDTIKSFTGGKVLSSLKEARRIIRNPKNRKKIEGEDILITENSWRILETLIKDSKAAYQFLQQYGIPLDIISQCGGHSKPRTHRSLNKSDKPINVGSEIISKLAAFITDSLKERVTVKLGHNAIELLKFNNDNDHNNTANSESSITVVKGVRVLNIKENTTQDIMADAVILTTGGYGQDREGFLKQYAPHTSSLPSTNGMWANGDGIKMAVRDVNASLIDMAEIQIHPTAFLDPNDPSAMTLILAPESLRGYGAIIVNQEGKRFINELGTRDEVSDSIFEHCGKEAPYPHVTAYMVMNDFVMTSFGESLTSFYVKKGLIRKYENFTDLCEKENISLNFCENLEETILDYDDFVDSRRSNVNFKDTFGKSVFPSKFNLEEKKNAPIYMARITPAIHYTQGGLLFNSHAQVLRRKTQEINEVIGNLYAAGEVTGGCHGKNRLAGNSLLECVVFGRIAATQAAFERN